MEKIKIWIKNYLGKNSKWKITGDVIFYIFIILMLIPATRKPISATLIRLTMRKPPVEKNVSLAALTAADQEFSFEDMNGQVYRLEDFQGEVILLNFWATWCPPCRAEMPSMQKLWDGYNQQIAMILISSEDKTTIQGYLNEKSFDLPVYIQRTPLPPSFPVGSIPTTFLINKKGEIVMNKRGAANWYSESFQQHIEALLEE